MKKLICSILAGASILGMCACNKTPESSVSQVGSNTATESTFEFGTDEYWASHQYLLDVTKEEDLAKIVNTLISCEPKLGSNRNTIYNNVVAAMGSDPITTSMYANQYTYDFEYSWTDKDYLEGKDRLISLGYTGYETKDDGDVFSAYQVIGYQENVLNAIRPAYGSATIYVYDETRANTAREHLNKCLVDAFADKNPEIIDDDFGYQLKCGEGAMEFYAYTRMTYQEASNCYVIYVCVTFADPELMATLPPEKTPEESVEETVEETIEETAEEET